MNEKVFVSHVVKSLNSIEGVWAYKIPDSPAFSGQMTRFGTSKPFDIIVDMMGEFIAVECKYMKGYRQLNKSTFQKKKDDIITRCQLSNLLEHEKCFVFINVFEARKINDLVVLDRNGITFLLDVGHFNKRSLMEMYKIKCGKNYHYDFEEFIADAKRR